MANQAGWTPTRTVGAGENTMPILFIDGPIMWRPTSTSDWVKLELVDDGTNSGIYIFKQTSQSADNVMPT